MAESDITAMKETLCAQQQLLQKLYAELDQEREASATAASEAMDMIVRLQGEKAAVKMEASHYKRVAEEKIGHAEATLEVFEELMYQKEMEITSLEFQVMAYKNKLLSLGSDFNASDFDFAEGMLLSRNDDQNNGENDQARGTIRRLSSLPPIPLKNNLRSARKRDRSPTPVPVPDMVPKTVDSGDQDANSPSMDLPRKSVDYAYGTLDAYWNQIKRLDEKVKVISDSKESGGEKYASLRSSRERSCSILSQASTKINRDQTDRVSPGSLDKVNHSEGTHDKESGGEKSASLRSSRGRSCSIFSQASTKIISDQTDRVSPGSSEKVNLIEGAQAREPVAIPSCSGNIHDVFEVPQTSEKHKGSEHEKRRLEKWITDADSRLTKPDSVSEEIIESLVKHDMDKLKNMLGGNHEIKTTSPKDTKTIVWQRKEGMYVDCNAQAEFQKLHQRIDQLEMETISARKEIMHKVNGEEHLRLLKDIYSQLKSMEAKMRSWKTQKTPPKKNNPLDPLQEAMMYFWI